MKTCLTLVLSAVYFSLVGINASYALAEGEKIKGFTVGQVIPGYNCMDVIYPPEAEENARLLPPVFAAPTERSRKLGTQGSIVYVAWPLNKVNGFVEILRFNGERGWIAEKNTKPFTYPKSTNTPGRCTISMTAAGSIGVQGYSLTAGKQ